MISRTFALTAALTLTALIADAARADVIAGWTFEVSGPSITGTGSTFGPIAPEIGSGAASGFHSSTATTTWSSPAGNGSLRSFSSNNWSVGDYYQFLISTEAYENITITFDQTGSNTGPRDFALFYSTNGVDFTNAGSYTLINGAWSSAVPVDTTTYSFDLSADASLNNNSTVYFRLVNMTTTSINGGTVAAAGTGRVDNIFISGDVIPAPGALALLGVAGLMVRRRRR